MMNLTAHTVKVTKKEAKTANMALTRRGASKKYATLEGSEASVSVYEANMRVTRGQQQRKRTEKQTEIQKDKIVPNIKPIKQTQNNNVPVAQEPSVSAASKRQTKRDDKKVNAMPNNKTDDKKANEKPKNVEN